MPGRWCSKPAWAELWLGGGRCIRQLPHRRPRWPITVPGSRQRSGGLGPRRSPRRAGTARIVGRPRLAPPYILVGHSLGGLYMQWYARYYPQEVAALILVDSTHPAQLKGRGAIENWPFWLRWLFDLWLPVTAERELAALDRTGDEVLAASAYRSGPVIVLSAAQPLADRSELADDANRKRQDLARLYPGSIQIWVDSGHAIPLERPEAVVAAIRDVLDAVRSEAGLLRREQE
ncbi:alpha/beta fold hydrolase [Methylomonas koyamae]|uniref:alpha/beta fold hydrolase n=1 Tax=Methylomonas koyamae TaxID=702114 RepID=UPI00210F918E|nr:alpha/beta hydrolase [Methylomonas koyamae]